MTFVISQTSHDTIEGLRNFSTIEDLIRFQKRNKQELIIKHNCFLGEPIQKIMEYYEVDKETAKQISITEYEIEIYDDYRE